MENKEKDTEVINSAVEEEVAPEAGKPKSEHHHSHHSHHGHHHRHHHHHRHRRHRNDRRNDRKRKKLIWMIVNISCLIFAIGAVVFGAIISSGEPSRTEGSGGIVSSEDILSVQIENASGVLVKNAIKEYISIDMTRPENAGITPSSLSNGEGRLDEEVPVVLKFTVKTGTVYNYKVEISEESAFRNATVSYVEPTTKKLVLNHLYTNTNYYYRVTAYTSKGADVETGSFKTADTPRILSIDGISNVRDIGNWRTDSGKRIKQGMLYRGTELDGAVESKYCLTNRGIVDMLEVLGIKSDFDLRAESSTPRAKDALGATVTHNYYGMAQYTEILSTSGKERVRALFADLADASNYPIYLHCTYGCDRAGTAVYLLEALLGVSRSDCITDYGISGRDVSFIKTVETELAKYGGNTLKQQVERYLLSIGVTEPEIDSIRKIFLGD